MNKELQALAEKMDDKYNEAEGFFNKGEIENGNAATKEYMAMQQEYENRKALLEAKMKKVEDSGTTIHDGKSPENENKVAFFNSLRNRNINNAMTVGSDEDGGYTVPEDIQTKINEYREARDVLTNLVTVEPVTAPTGARTFKKRSQQTGFAEVEELNEIPENAIPKFTRLKYDVKKYAGFLPTSNELLADSDAAIEHVIISWLGNESRVTRNKLILSVLDAKERTTISTVDDIKKATNVTLDPAFHATTSFVTNQDGFNWLDTLKDANGRYLLQDSISSSSGKQLFGRNVIVISNSDLPTQNGLAPMIIGDLKEAVTLFDRKQLNVVASKVADKSFITDSTLFRAIERLDIRLRDEEAFVYGQINLGGEAASRMSKAKSESKGD